MTDDFNPLGFILQPENENAAEQLTELAGMAVENEMLLRMEQKDVDSQQGQYEKWTKVMACIQALKVIQENAVELLAYKAQKEGWYFVGEFATVQEWLDSFTAGSVHSDAAFLNMNVVPLMEKLGRDPHEWVGKNNKLSSNIRATVPQLREAMATLEPEQVVEKWTELLEIAADPQENEASIRGRYEGSKKVIARIQGQDFVHSDGSSTVILVMDLKQRALFENRMDGKIELWRPNNWPKFLPKQANILEGNVPNG